MPPVPRMLTTPALHSHDVLRAAKVVLVLRLGKPPALTGRLARLTARGLAAIPLVPHIARIRPEQHPATQALTLSLACHGSALPGAGSCAAARAKPMQRVSEEQASHPAQPRKGPTKKRRRTEEKPGSRDVNLRKKRQEEKTLSHRQFLTTFRTPMTLARYRDIDLAQIGPQDIHGCREPVHLLPCEKANRELHLGRPHSL